MDPPRPRATHGIAFDSGHQLCADDQHADGAREKAAAMRMIDATKRWSQESTIYIGALARLPKMRTARHLRALSVRTATMRAIQHPPRLPLSLSPTARLRVTSAVQARMTSVPPVGA